MGRRFIGNIPEEMLEDQGIPGKLYFAKPMVIEIPSKHSDTSTMVSTVRTLSTQRLRDFNHNCNATSYRCSQRPTAAELKDYLHWAEIQGFGLGAVVARRFCAHWRAEAHHQWGVIIGCIGFSHPTSPNQPWAPFVVQWFSKEFGQAEPTWAEDLYVIHQSLSKNLLNSILEEQEGEIT